MRPDPLLFHPALLPAVTQGREVVLGKAGETVELPCQGSQKKNVFFNWKYPSEVKILGGQRTWWVKGMAALLPVFLPQLLLAQGMAFGGLL